MERQRGDSLTYQPPKSSKPQSSTKYDSKTFLRLYFFWNFLLLVFILLKKSEKAAHQENDLTNDEFVAEVKVFWLYEISALK